ncbi:uncharacterized protein METZ01_LOCUS331931, partial [marine metagenome]
MLRKLLLFFVAISFSANSFATELEVQFL